MRKKVLLVSKNEEYRALFDQAFTPLLEQGGELLFTETVEQTLILLEQEHPSLLFMDEEVAASFTPPGDTPIVWIRKKGAPDTLSTHFSLHDLLTVAKPYLDSLLAPFPPL